jgi:hypothetical protein
LTPPIPLQHIANPSDGVCDVLQRIVGTLLSPSRVQKGARLQPKYVAVSGVAGKSLRYYSSHE